MKKLILVAIGVLGLAACKDKGSDTPTPFQDRVPDRLAFVAPEKGEMPSDAQLKEVQDTFNTKTKMILPPGELISPSQEMTTAEVNDKELKLKKEDVNSYNMLKDIQANCNTSAPVLSTNFPKDGQTTTPLKTGDVFSYEMKAGVFEKATGCPMNAKTEGAGKVVIEDYDQTPAQTKKRLGASMGGSGKLEVLIKKPEYQRLLNSRGMIVDTNISALNSVIDSDSKVYMSGNMNGSYISLTKQIDFTTTMEVASKASTKNGDPNGRSEVVAKAEMIYPGFKISVVTHTVSEGSKTVLQEMYLNGNKLNDGQQQKIFKREVPGIGVVGHSALLKALK